MELPVILFLSGVAGVFAGMLNNAAAPFFAHADTRVAWRKQSWLVQLASIGTHLLWSLALGWLFWLSWGLTAIVSVAWWWRGLCFAAIAWVAACAPLLLDQALHARLSWRLLAQSAWNSFVVCFATSLACAWSWGGGR